MHLQPTSIQISNIFEDLQDGIVLLKLLEVLCGESIKVPEIKVKMKIHKMINLECVMSFLQQRLNLDFRNFNIGAEDVASGNEKITLGLVCTFCVQFLNALNFTSRDNYTSVANSKCISNGCGAVIS